MEQIMTSQADKGRAFRALHERNKLFVIPNPWDGASAKLLASQGFEALTTTSAGLAFVIGKPDGGVTREESLWNAKLVVDSVDLPVAADLENGFGHRPEDAAEAIRAAAAIGLVGGSIEDATGDAANPIYDFGLAVERVAAAAEVARSLDFDFTFVARAENYLHGRKDLDDTLKRLQAYEKAGADVLFAPGLPGIEAIRTVVQSVGKPVNVVQSAGGIPLAELEAVGVRRVSLGGGLARVALTALKRAGEEIRATGTFGFADDIVTTAWVNELMKR
jgi:2-methylisocitrate lyase-like PEP mutase family enzyme